MLPRKNEITIFLEENNFEHSWIDIKSKIKVKIQNERKRKNNEKRKRSKMESQNNSQGICFYFRNSIWYKEKKAVVLSKLFSCEI